MTVVQLTQGKTALVDDADAENVLRHKWHVDKCGRNRQYEYAVSRIDGRRVYLHRWLMKPPKGMYVDHANGNCLDNRRENLRICTPQQNRWNSKNSRNTDKGVHFVSGLPKPWRACVRVNGEYIHLGYFAEKETARNAYEAFAKDLQKEFFRT